MWVDYISKVFRGEFIPKRDYITSRILDYACSVYVVICGPDGESILFWTKYTGVFPTNIPSSAFNWSKGNLMKMPEYTISYKYAWKEDFNPMALAEFNINSKLNDLTPDTKITPVSVYEPLLVSTGKSFVGAPYIEQVYNNTNDRYIFKLRFRSLD